MGVYITRVRLDESKKATQLALSRPSMFHGAIEESLDLSPERKLWRIDRVGNTPFLLVVSESVPGMSSIIEQFGDGSPADTKDYGKMLNGIHKGDTLKFRLEANPQMKRDKRTGSQKRVAKTTFKNQMEWLGRKSEKCGFSIVNAEVTSSSWKTFRHAGNSKVMFMAVVFEGQCTITDEELFKNTLVSGIGREKAFGMGLMTVMRTR